MVHIEKYATVFLQQLCRGIRLLNNNFHRLLYYIRAGVRGASAFFSPCVGKKSAEIYSGTGLSIVYFLSCDIILTGQILKRNRKQLVPCKSGE